MGLHWWLRTCSGSGLRILCLGPVDKSALCKRVWTRIAGACSQRTGSLQLWLRTYLLLHRCYRCRPITDCQQRPFVNYYATTFILYELSSPFLNIHWFCDKLNLTGSKLQLYNGFLLIGTFFAARLCWGTYSSIRVFYDVYRALTQPGGPADTSTSQIMRFAADEQTVPLWLAGTYLASNLTLNSLNFYWFGKMIETVRKRFDPPLGTKRPIKKVKTEEEKVLVEGIELDTDEEVEKTNGSTTAVDTEPVVARGLYDDGRRTVEVSQTEVRRRG